MYRTPRNARTLVDLVGGIALMRHADDLMHQSKRCRDLGCSRQKRNDSAHHLINRSVIQKEMVKEKLIRVGLSSAVSTVLHGALLCSNIILLGVQRLDDEL